MRGAPEASVNGCDRIELARLFAVVPKSVHRWYKVQAALEDRGMSDVVMDALLDYCNKVSSEQNRQASE